MKDAVARWANRRDPITLLMIFIAIPFIAALPLGWLVALVFGPSLGQAVIWLCILVGVMFVAAL